MIGFTKALIGGFVLLIGSVASARGWPSTSVLDLSYRIDRPNYPVAAYRNISVPGFRSMVRKAFQASGFTFVSVDEQKDRSTIFRFSYNADLKMGPQPEIVLSADELPNGKKGCDPCFLRFAQIKNIAEIRTLPWMVQYNLSALLIPAIDQAYSILESSGREHSDPSYGFNYKRQWAGERNLFGNSFAGISLPKLKESVVSSYRNAGFIPIEGDTDPKSSNLELIFSFPIDPPKDSGAIYKVRIHSQFDADGNCHPCEIVEQYNPYQQLPPAGLSGILNRATLESRFTAARDAAYEGMRTGLQGYLRPRSVFLVPPKPAALGSPPPPATPPVVT